MLGGLKKPENRRRALVVVGLLVAALLLARHCSSPGPPPPEDLPTYAAGEAAAHAGRHARVCGRVVDAAYASGTEGRPTFLNFGRPYPDPVFTALIWGEDRARFSAPPERAYLDRRICVRGRIEMHEGRPEIVVRSPAQLEPAVPGG
jgi:hypothetical protein